MLWLLLATVAFATETPTDTPTCTATPTATVSPTPTFDPYPWQERRVCQKCRSQGARRTVQATFGYRYLYLIRFYDEAGRLHVHDPNGFRVSWSCSLGHDWQENMEGSCWCGWPKIEGDDGKTEVLPNPKKRRRR